MKKFLGHLTVATTMVVAGLASADEGQKTATPQTTGVESGQGVETSEPMGQTTIKLDDNAKKFIKEVSADNMAEIDVARLAQKKASDPQVKSLAERIISDHQQAGMGLQKIAAAGSVPMSKAVPDDAQKQKKDLEKLSGAAFDKKFVDMMVDDHKKEIDKFETAANDVKNHDLEVWITDTLPKLRQHQMQAEDLQTMLKQKGQQQGQIQKDNMGEPVSEPAPKPDQHKDGGDVDY
jgi:putative membrane protein